MNTEMYLTKVKHYKMRPIENMAYIVAYLATVFEARTGIEPDEIRIGKQADTYPYGFEFYKNNEPLRLSFMSIPRGFATKHELLGYVRGMRDYIDLA